MSLFLSFRWVEKDTTKAEKWLQMAAADESKDAKIKSSRAKSE